MDKTQGSHIGDQRSFPHVDARQLWTKITNCSAYFLLAWLLQLKMLKKNPVLSQQEAKLWLLEMVISLLGRTFSSDFLPDQVKRRRAEIWANNVTLVNTPMVFIKSSADSQLATGKDRCNPSNVDFVRHWGDRKGTYFTLYQAMPSIVVARVQRETTPDLFWPLITHTHAPSQSSSPTGASVPSRRLLRG
ncbi:hypothetical protein EI94DRAFT_435170 [Lactarius quietus]|nr:hypothetical protein EI94DRAFT_435170 [Lactarius quietus]